MAKTKAVYTVNLEVSIPVGVDAQWNLLMDLARSFGVEIKTNSNQTEGKIDLHNGLKECGFFNLPRVKALKCQDILIELLKNNDIHYKIAMLHHLELFETTYRSSSLEALYWKLSKIFDVPLRRIKGNKLVLNTKSDEKRTRYKAYEFIKKVAIDYDKLKLGHAP